MIILIKSERERQIPYGIIYVGNLKTEANELIYKTETDSQAQKTNLQLPKWRAKLGVWDQQIQATKQMNNKVLLVQHRELYSISYNKP